MSKTPDRPQRREIKAQPGPQTVFLSTSADIAIYGGAAGGGKSYAELLEATRHSGNANFGAVIFRRTYPQIMAEGGLWDTSMDIYPALGAQPSESKVEWKFPSGATVSFRHLQYDASVLEWQSSQIPLLMYDELTHFSEYQFFYMLSRNRSACGVRPYVRATTNPDPDSWVARFISWWIDPNTGYAIPERSGKVRWMVRKGKKLMWFDSKEAALPFCPTEAGVIVPPKSVTFIAASVHDNQILLKADPGYVGNLVSLPEVEREQLLKGNWKIRRQAGSYFNRNWFEIVDVAPQFGQDVRYWDRAATEKTEDNDPDATAGVKLRKSPEGVYYIMDVKRIFERPLGVKQAIMNTASQEPDCAIRLEQDPGQAGIAEVEHLIRELAGYNVGAVRVSKDKVTRCLPASAQAQAGNIKLVRGDWNEDFLNELDGFDGDKDKHDDQVDALSGAFNELALEGNPRIRYA